VNGRQLPVARRRPEVERVRSKQSVLLLGEGWFPDRAGGICRVVRELHEALYPFADVRTQVLGPATEPLDGVSVAGRADDPLIRRMLAYWASARAAARDAEVVDAHFALYALPLLLTGALRKRPLVVHFHGPWADESRAAGDRSALRLWTKRAVERYVYRRATLHVAHSAAFKRILVERYGVPPWDVRVIPPGVALDRFVPGDRRAARARLGLPLSSKVIVSARRLVPRMGLDVLLEACACLEPDLLDRLVVLIAGDGPERGRLEAQATELGLEGRVRFLGPLSDEALVDAYCAATVCVVPSVALEGFGLVALEGLACGTPVVATDAGGLGATVGGLDESLIVPARDPCALSRRLGAALGASRQLPSRPRCRRYAEGYSWEASARRHAEIYREARLRRSGVSSTRPKVVYLDHCARLSGGELALLRLLDSLGDTVDAHVVLAEDGPLLGKLALAGVSHEVVELAATARELPRQDVTMAAVRVRETLYVAAHVIRLARRLRRLRPDLVHANSLKAFVYGGLAARLARVPIVWHVRDRIAPDYLPVGAVRLIGALARHLPDAVIANSRETLEMLGAATGALGGGVPHAVVYDPVGLCPAPRRNGQRSLRVGMLGRIAPWKGQHVFLEAFADAFASGGEQAAIVGAPLFGEEDYERELRRLAGDLGIAGRVEFAGHQTDVAAELAQLDVLVHASLLPEPLGQVVQEGMRAGVPVVASEGGGPSELIQDGRTGFLYPRGDVTALTHTLRRVGGDAGLRRSVGGAARAEARLFDPERVARQVLTVYRGVLER
jgi:glycosyltransferase involved in cell wall biosynthesis